MIVIKFFKKIWYYFCRLFYWSSGANYQILKELPSEQNKYYGIGGTIIFTALMASFAGGYAFFTAFKSTWLSVFFGIFWGALIFNLDRYIVSTFGVGDGKKTISKQELIEAAPRLAMAILLGYVIATPLELKLFEREINAQISQTIDLEQNKIIQRGLNDPILANLQQEKSEIQKNIKNRNSIIETKRNFWEKANRDKNDEWNLGKFSGKKGKGGYYSDLKKVADNAEQEYLKAKQELGDLNNKGYFRIEEINDRMGKRETKINNEIESQKTVEAQNDGLIARLKALDKLMYEEINITEIQNGQEVLVGRQKEKTVVWYAKWLITLLFIFIEIAPILFKMMTERGPYDDVVDRIKHKVKVNQLLLQSNLNQEINTKVKIHNDKTEQKLSAELLANKELLNEIAKAQAEIAREAIQEWKKEQKKKVKEGISGIIN